MNRAIFFDRDGVINKRIKGDYVRSWEEFRVLPEVGEVLKEVKRRGFYAIVITNQRGVGRGLMTEEALNGIHNAMQHHFETSHDTTFDDILFCADAEDTSTRRKPSPAMLHEAAEKWNIDLSQSWMIGDSASDVAAGKAAGTHTAYLITEHTTQIPVADAVLHSIKELLSLI